MRRPIVTPHRFAAIDELARPLAVGTAFHDRYDDRPDYSGERERMGSEAARIGFCAVGIKAERFSSSE